MPRHAETRLLPHTADEMYALVADVERYPEFLPWCSAARLLKVTEAGDHRVMEADLVISFKVFREKFGSLVKLYDADRRVETRYIDGPFRYMHSTWAFRDVEGGCEVDFSVDFEFRNPVLRAVIGVVFNEAMQRIVRAFENRAAALHGAEA